MKAYLWLKDWLEGEEGQGLVEYGLIIALVSIALIIILGVMSGALSGVFQYVSDKLGTATGT